MLEERELGIEILIFFFFLCFSKIGLFVCKFFPAKAGTHLAMVRFNGENIQNKWAKISVSSAQVPAHALTHRCSQTHHTISSSSLILWAHPLGAHDCLSFVFISRSFIHVCVPSILLTVSISVHHGHAQEAEVEGRHGPHRAESPTEESQQSKCFLSFMKTNRSSLLSAHYDVALSPSPSLPPSGKVYVYNMPV